MNWLTPNTWLKIIEISHYILGIFIVPYYCFTIIKIIYPALGIFALDGDSGFWIAILLILAITIFFGCIACILLSGRYINRRSNYTFTVVVACLECFVTRYGLFVGIVTLILFSQPSIKNIYNLDRS